LTTHGDAIDEAIVGAEGLGNNLIDLHLPMNYFHSMNQSLDRLKVLGVLLRLKSPSRAAIELGVTQSAISKTLAVLRAEYNDALLIRRGDTMVPTAFGEKIANPLNSALNNLEQVIERKNQPRHPRSFSIAMRDQFVLTLGPRLIRAFCKSKTPGEIEFVAYDRATVFKSLELGDFDLAVAVDPPPTPGLMSRKLYQDQFVCFTPQKRAPSLQEYLKLPQIATTAHMGYSGIDDYLSSQKLTRSIVAKVPYFLAALHLAQKERLTLTLPQRLGQQTKIKGFYMHPLPIEIPGFSAQLIWDVRFQNDETNVWLRQLVIEASRLDGTKNQI
jgi:LysR family transcriptional activator of mexEF-oprN operon